MPRLGSVCVALMVVLAACASTSEPDPAPIPPSASSPPAEAPPPTAVAPITPLPPPPPVPAALPRSFVVFFDAGKTTLSADARRVILEARDAYRSHKAQRLTIVGHTDRAGVDARNGNLSLRRALAVRRAFMAAGIPAAEIGVGGRGASELAFATTGGVAEPQNRRVEIRF